MDDEGSLLFDQSLADLSSLLDEVCGGHGVVAGDLHSTATSESLQNLHFKVSKLLKTTLVHLLSWEEISSHPEAA